MAKARRAAPKRRAGARTPAYSGLLESRQFRQLIDGVPHAMVVLNDRGEIVIINSRTEKLFGYTAAELIGKKVEIIVPEGIAERREHAREVEARRILRARRRDGSEFPAEIDFSPLETDEGVLLSGFIREQLADSEQRYRSLFDDMPLALFRTSPDGKIHEANGAMLSLLGYPSREALLATNAADHYVDPADRRRYLDELERSGLVRGFETRLRRLDGSEILVDLSALPVRGADGQILRIEGSLADVTERHRAEAALAASEKRFRTLFETVNLIALSLDSSGNVDYVNPFFLKVTGYTAEEVVGKSWFEFMPETQRAGMRGAFRELLDQGVHPHFENSIVTKSGEERMIAWHNTVLRDADGRPLGSLSIGEDVTERRSLQAQLIQAQKMEAVGLLAGGIAHDFNNLLGAITVFGELAAADLPEGDRRRADLDSIQEAVARATTLTRQLLTFSRQQVLRPRVLDPNVVIADLLKILGRLIGEDIELISKLDPGAGLVRVDESQLEQVLMNLAVNARDAMPAGGRLTVMTSHVRLDEAETRVKGLAQPGNFVVLTVTDTGSGIPGDVLPRMFEPFFTTKGARGTGLGLATVYGIVKQSGGYVGVTSEVGKGTTFTIYLPSVSGLASEPAVAASEEPAAGGSETILVVEDDPAVRLAVSSVLSRLGYTVLVARTAEDALVKATTHEGPINLVVSDVVMPGMDGPTLIEELGRVRREMKALLTSGYAGDAIRQHQVNESGVPFLEKPFTAVRLAQRVREVLDGIADTNPK